VLSWPLLRILAQPVYRRFNTALRQRVEQLHPAPP
jgi:hypothetical protein